MEPRLVVFVEEDGAEIVQMFLCAENSAICELPVASLNEGFIVLMAAYYVLDVEYPGSWKPTLLFFQDFLMDKKEPTKGRPVRYATYTKQLGL